MFDGIMEYFFLNRIARSFKRPLRKKYSRKMVKYNLKVVKITYKNIARRYSMSIKKIYYSLPLKVIVADLEGAYGLCAVYMDKKNFFNKEKVAKSTITLNRTSITTTTFIHEFGHYIRFLIGQIASTKNEKAFEDFKLLTDLVRSRADVAKNKRNNYWLRGAFTVEEEENFAKTWEQYFRDGDAPTKKLKKLFTTFKREIFYDMHRLNEERSKKGWRNYEFFEDLEVKVTPERRKFLDTLLLGQRLKKRAITPIILEWYIYLMFAFIILRYLIRVFKIEI
ncbi:MAG: hypothetical protein LBT02_00940 [Rickettsiales bacterium]|jgi:hypothetical protein|nr:hypothetical protein [Rickettsiales bacterium]